MCKPLLCPDNLSRQTLYIIDFVWTNPLGGKGAFVSGQFVQTNAGDRGSAFVQTNASLSRQNVQTNGRGLRANPYFHFYPISQEVVFACLLACYTGLGPATATATITGSSGLTHGALGGPLGSSSNSGGRMRTTPHGPMTLGRLSAVRGPGVPNVLRKHDRYFETAPFRGLRRGPEFRSDGL